MAKRPKTAITHLECSKCHEVHSHEKLLNLCECGGPLLARYDIRAVAKTLTRKSLRTRPITMWRYTELLPAREPISLGEGMTPLIHA
ncbi:MAG: hypothetical protein WBP79_02050, partial [Candidatus Acidiferrales bacterium]